MKEIDNFFGIYKELEEKKIKAKGWEGLQETQKIIRECRERNALSRE